MKRPPALITPAQIDDFMLWALGGVVLGGRLGFVLFYKPMYYLSHPIEIFYVWQGGMSFHGGFLGVLVAMWLFGRKTQRTFWQVTDFIAPLVPLGLAAGRMGNFINAELWGRPTDLPWAMVFPNGGPEPRHPSQLYEAALEGLVLFVAYPEPPEFQVVEIVGWLPYDKAWEIGTSADYDRSGNTRTVACNDLFLWPDTRNAIQTPSND